jgi:hypothetical protein
MAGLEKIQRHGFFFAAASGTEIGQSHHGPRLLQGLMLILLSAAG